MCSFKLSFGVLSVLNRALVDVKCGGLSRSLVIEGMTILRCCLETIQSSSKVCSGEDVAFEVEESGREPSVSSNLFSSFRLP